MTVVITIFIRTTTIYISLVYLAYNTITGEERTMTMHRYLTETERAFWQILFVQNSHLHFPIKAFKMPQQHSGQLGLL